MPHLPLQYIRWVASLLQGDWGWSPTANQEVFPELLAETLNRRLDPRRYGRV